MVSWLDIDDGFAKITHLAKQSTPMLFIISYNQEQIYAQPLDKLDDDILYHTPTKQNYKSKKHNSPVTLKRHPIEFDSYQKSFDRVIEEIKSGNTYLLNLTFRTYIDSSLTLKEIFESSKAPFKLYFKDKFICFSPEAFVQIEDNTISTYPMKGTIDANIPNAKQIILDDYKEMAEHTMIVDLMRNDLGIIADDVRVDDFRYVEKIQAGDKELLQISSKITASLNSDWRDNLGLILSSLLPAGSITGTPKKSTTQIIKDIEDYDRGFYTGVFGIFDGESLYSSVMIRFIDRDGDKLVYKSGGGITIDSSVSMEYKEMVDKVYLPL